MTREAGGRPDRPLRLLVVDDQPAEFRLVEAGFAAAGIPVQLATATTGHLAMASLLMADEEERPDAALIDIGMPAISGFEVVRSFAGGGMPMILISALVDDERRLRAREAGAVTLLSKPQTVDGYRAVAEAVVRCIIAGGLPDGGPRHPDGRRGRGALP